MSVDRRSWTHEPRIRPTAKLFTVEQANAALPLVRAITADLVRLSREVIERRERLALLAARHVGHAKDPYAEELAQIEEELDKDSQQLQAYVEELRELGVEPKSGPEGLVDFPAMIDDRLVYLCWKLGEPRSAALARTRRRLSRPPVARGRQRGRTLIRRHAGVD